MTQSLFGDEWIGGPQREHLGPGAVLLHGRALPVVEQLLAAIREVEAQAPFRRMATPGGFEMSVVITNCGVAGWVTDSQGYRYQPIDPVTGKHWPPMPEIFRTFATGVAAEAGYQNFVPDVCPINRYLPGARMSLHQDRNERGFGHPIVSVSLGLPAIFQFGGEDRGDKTQRFALQHGDVAVWGGPSRLAYHGILPLKDGEHPLVGRQRLNLTFRKAL
jgi:alkylated DNA repair protein (DNA oxidative demethylase)